MAKKREARQFLTTILLLAITACIVLILVHQTNQLVAVLAPEPTATAVQAYSSGGGGSGIDVEMEDVLPTITPTIDISHQE